MRSKQIVSFILAAAVLVSFAGVSLAEANREKEPRFKGVELYSWKSDGGNGYL